MGQTFTFGRLFGIRVGVHISWIAVFLFMTFSIAGTIEEPQPLAYAIAACCALLLFASVVAHEFAHALVARRFGVQTRAITLFLFGGVAMLESEPPTPRAEVAIALAGPAMSALLSALAYGLLVLLDRTGGGVVVDVLKTPLPELAVVNAILAVFNLLPAFPMDGGRVLRAAIWHVRRSHAAATGAASLAGIVLAAGFIVAGPILVFVTRTWQAAWYALIGAFLLRQGWLQFRESRLLERLERVRVRDVMDAAGEEDVPTGVISLASGSNGLDALAAFRAGDAARIPVVDGGRLSGWLRRDRAFALLERAA